VTSLILSLAREAIDLALAGHLSATGTGSAEPEMPVDDLLDILRHWASAKARRIARE
jgi:hypothetical protein